KGPARPTAATRPRTGRTPSSAIHRGLAPSDRPGSPAGNNSIPRPASAPSRARQRRPSASPGSSLAEQPLDDHAVAPEPIQLSVPPMNPDFPEPEAFQRGAAGRVLRKDPAGEFVQPGRFSRLDQRGKGCAAGTATAIIPPYIDREFADAAVAGPA